MTRSPWFFHHKIAYTTLAPERHIRATATAAAVPCWRRRCGSGGRGQRRLVDLLNKAQKELAGADRIESLLLFMIRFAEVNDYFVFSAGTYYAVIKLADLTREEIVLIAQVDKELVAAGLLDGKSGRPSEKIIAQLSWEREEILPTPGVLVKGCLDKCATCEPALEKQIELELEHMRLKNEKLQREIELFDMSQEYRCCPAGEKESDGA